jgi:hypothetical protein
MPRRPQDSALVIRGPGCQVYGHARGHERDRSAVVNSLPGTGMPAWKGKGDRRTDRDKPPSCMSTFDHDCIHEIGVASGRVIDHVHVTAFGQNQPRRRGDAERVLMRLESPASRPSQG